MGITIDCIDLDSGHIYLNKMYKEALKKLKSESIITVFPTIMEGKKTCLILKAPKTKKSKRFVFMTEPLKQEIIQRIEQIERDKKRLDERYNDYGLLFCLENGNPIEPKLMEKWFKAWQKEQDVYKRQHVYGVDIDSLQAAVVQEYRAKKLTLATAESCTGGLVSKRITEIPGASEIFLCGLCTYSNEMKERLLGVSHQTLEQYGAVSEQTAREMARGVRLASGAAVGVSTTGIAGPGGGSAEKPVGLVYVGIDSAAYSKVDVYKRQEYPYNAPNYNNQHWQ